MVENNISLESKLEGRMESLDSALLAIRNDVSGLRTETFAKISKLENDAKIAEEKIESRFAVQESVNMQFSAEVGKVKSSVLAVQQVVDGHHRQFDDINKNLQVVKETTQRQDARLILLEDSMNGIGENIMSTVQREISNLRPDELEQTRSVNEMLSKKVTELEERMYAAQRSANVGNVVSHAALPNYLRFHGESKEQPYSFLTALENYFLVNGTPETMKLRFVEEALSSKAQYWWQALTPTPRSYEEWRGKFLERYWNQHHRFELRYRLMSEKYRKGSAESMCDFVTRKVSAFKICSENFDPAEIIRILIRQMPGNVRNLLWNNMPETIDELIERVSRFDQTNDGNDQDSPNERSRFGNNGGGTNGYNGTKYRQENVCAVEVRTGEKAPRQGKPQGGPSQQQPKPKENGGGRQDMNQGESEAKRNVDRRPEN